MTDSRRLDVFLVAAILSVLTVGAVGFLPAVAAHADTTYAFMGVVITLVGGGTSVGMTMRKQGAETAAIGGPTPASTVTATGSDATVVVEDQKGLPQ